jgi:methanogenic corrinoid protein MtbC1
MSGIKDVFSAIENGKPRLMETCIDSALKEGYDPLDILNEGMVSAMDAIGSKFADTKIFVPELLISSRTMKKGMDTIKPYLNQKVTKKIGKVIIGTVAGDLHDIGKNLVSMMMESSGLEVIDLGVDVPEEKFLQAVENNPEVKIVCCCAVLTCGLHEIKHIIEAFDRKHLSHGIKITVGGAAITESFADSIGAEYTPTAALAAKRANEILYQNIPY